MIEMSTMPPAMTAAMVSRVDETFLSAVITWLRSRVTDPAPRRSDNEPDRHRRECNELECKRFELRVIAGEQRLAHQEREQYSYEERGHLGPVVIVVIALSCDARQHKEAGHEQHDQRAAEPAMCGIVDNLRRHIAQKHIEQSKVRCEDSATENRKCEEMNGFDRGESRGLVLHHMPDRSVFERFKEWQQVHGDSKNMNAFER